MNKRFLEIYNDELGYLRKTGSLFSSAYPGVAGRLGTIETDALCSDPFVERLLEGFAFLSARVQHKLNSDFPLFTQSILETINPFILRPLPSATIVKFHPDFNDDGLETGFKVGKGTSLFTEYSDNVTSRCEYTTTGEVCLWPFEIAEASFYSREIASLKLPDNQQLSNAKSAIRIKCDMGTSASFNSLAIDMLPIYVCGGRVGMRLMEMILTDCKGILIRDTGSGGNNYSLLSAQCISAIGFNDSEKLLPYDSRIFSGYRLIHEYFALFEKFMFINLQNIGSAINKCQTSSIELIFLFNKQQTDVPDNFVSKSNFLLYCAPAINLFSKNIGRISVSDAYPKIHLVVDRMRPVDYEIYSITEVKGYIDSSNECIEFEPFSFSRASDPSAHKKYYSIERQPYLFAVNKKANSKYSEYRGSEVYVYLVDSENLPYHNNLRQIGVKVVCTNRDLPFRLKTSSGSVKFTTSSVCPSGKIENVSHISVPVDCCIEGKSPWMMLNFLTVNYLLLNDTENGKAIESLKDLLRLFCTYAGNRNVKHIEGLSSLQINNVVRRFVIDYKPVFLRGVSVELEFDDNSFTETGFFVLGMVIARFLSSYVSLNSFVETTIKSKDKGTFIKCPAIIGTQNIL